MTKLEQAGKSLQRLAKWRSLFTGWQLGTRPKGDPECDAVRDHRETTILQRAEMSALARIMIEKGVCTPEEFTITVGDEAEELMRLYERRFPGVRAIDDGLEFGPEAVQTMRDWLP